MRKRLKQATNEAHERMHAHPGFAAAAAGTIKPGAYRDLLARLYGFHAAFDLEMQAAPAAFAQDIDLPARARADLIADDLVALGVSRAGVAALPRCEDLPRLSGEGDRLGALYVVEGSTLGGVFIARALAATAGNAHRFFLGHESDHSRLWRDLVRRLDKLDATPEEAAAAEFAALATFDAFERWMANWESAAGTLERAVA